VSENIGNSICSARKGGDPAKIASSVSVSPGEGRLAGGRRMKFRFRRERRKSGRVGLNLPVEFRIYLPSCPEIASRFLSGQLHDFSQEGLALFTNVIHSNSLHMFHPTAITSEQCLLEIRIPTGAQALTLHGRVIWYDRIDEQGPFLFHVGVRLLEHPKDLKTQIETSVREHRTAEGAMG